jgi:hypothetical protein
MSSEDNHIKYSTRWVTIPLITADDADANNTGTEPTSTRRHAALPSRLGPWPLKRSLSEADWIVEKKPDTFDLGPAKNPRPTLATVLGDIEEECKKVDAALMELEAAVADSSRDTEMQSIPEVRREGKRMSVGVARALFLLLWLFPLLLMVSEMLFVRGDWGSIRLPASGTARVVLGGLLAIPTFLTGVVYAVVIIIFGWVQDTWKLSTGRSRALAAAAAIISRIAFAGWAQLLLVAGY